MSLPAPRCDAMPEQPIQVARAAVPKGNPAMQRRDARGPLSTHRQFATLFSHTGRPAQPPRRSRSFPCGNGPQGARRRRRRMRSARGETGKTPLPWS